MNQRTVTDLPHTELTVGPKWDGSQGNWDSNRAYPLKLVVIHTMVGTVQSANTRFNDPHSNVSAHYGVGFDGTIYHWVDETNVAYHAGDYAVNQSSIGIEHEDQGNYNAPRPDALYEASAKLVADLCQFYTIPCDRDHIKKHSEVSDQPTGCPDALDVDRIVREAQAILNPPAPEITFTPQTIIPLPDPYKPQELQAVISMLKDKDAKIQQLENQSHTPSTVGNPPIPSESPSTPSKTADTAVTLPNTHVTITTPSSPRTLGELISQISGLVLKYVKTWHS